MTNTHIYYILYSNTRVILNLYDCQAKMLISGQIEFNKNIGKNVCKTFGV